MSTSTASLFMNGRSQAVRLPAEFRFEGKQVFIYRDRLTGNVILSSKPEISPWQDFMAFRALLTGVEGCADSKIDEYWVDRDQTSQTRDPFESWVE
jgi:antitoxin VapB